MRIHLLPLLALLVACEKVPESGAPATTVVEAAAPPVAPPANAKEAKVSAVDVAGLKAAMDDGTIHLIDVRTVSEFASGHVPGAVNIPLSDLEARIGELDGKQGEPLYMICARGGRSAKATAVLSVKGFQQPVNVEGGTIAWTSAGYPIE
jgi:rhodanese-related sulfurtransferase